MNTHRKKKRLLSKKSVFLEEFQRRSHHHLSPQKTLSIRANSTFTKLSRTVGTGPLSRTLTVLSSAAPNKSLLLQPLPGSFRFCLHVCLHSWGVTYKDTDTYSPSFVPSAQAIGYPEDQLHHTSLNYRKVLLVFRENVTGTRIH